MKFSQCQIAIEMDIARQGWGRGVEGAEEDRDAQRKVATFENTFKCTNINYIVIYASHICFIYSRVYIYIYAIYIRAFPTILQLLLLLLAPHSAAPTLPAAFSISPNAEEAAATTTATVAGANKCQVEQRRQRRGRGKGAWQGGAGPGSDWQQAARQVAADLAFFFIV